MNNKIQFWNNHSPCYGCERRKTGCHPTCEDYISYKKEHDASRMRLYREKEIKRLSISPQVKVKTMET